MRRNATYPSFHLAFVVLKPDFKGKVREEEIAEWCRAEMAVYKAPRNVRFIDALPKTASGKILKRVLRDQARAQVSPPQAR